MQEHQPSRTAMVAAFYRAHHAAHDASAGAPLIFADTLAGALLPESTRAAIAERLAHHFQEMDPAAAAGREREELLAASLRASPTAALVLSRARWAEDLLETALARGLTQYVILGAGLDTFALRRAGGLGALRVWEVDHPATQGFKRARLAELGWACPEGLRFVEADLSRESLAAVLAGAGYAAELPGFFNWLGVTYYLTPEAVLATLGAIAAIAAPGSRVVLDYREAPAGQAPARPGRAGLVRARLERLGEPVLSQFVPAELAASLAGLGLRVVEDLAPAEIQARYFAGRADGYQAHGQCRFLCAEVA